MTVKTVDFAGEHLSRLKTNADRAWETFTSEWEYDSVPTFEQLQDDKEQGNIDPAHLPSLLSVLAAEADLLGLVLPMYDFAEELDDVQLPHHIEQSDLKNYRRARSVPRHNNTNDRSGYFKIYEALISADNDFFFLSTMSDVFLETFEESDTRISSPLMSWESFRQHVWEYVQKSADRGVFTPALYLDMTDYTNLYPVYFEPAADDPRTPKGEFKPKLDWNDDHYSLRGLQYVLERIEN